MPKKEKQGVVISNEETTIATFQYKGHTLRDSEVSNYLSCITDYAGNTYEFSYEHGKLVSIAYNKTVIASYTMSRSNGWLQNELAGITRYKFSHNCS